MSALEESNQKTVTAATTSQVTSHTSQARRRILKDYLLVWIDTNIDETNQESQNIVKQFRAVDNNIEIFNERDQCIDFLTDIGDVKVFLIVADAIAQQITPIIHDIPQLYHIYVFSREQLPHEQWIKEWVKVKNVYTRTELICEALQLSIKQYNQDSIAMSFVMPDEVIPSENLNQLEPSFMYTQIFKEVLLEMEHDENSIKSFISFCRAGEYNTLKMLDEFEKEYNDQQAIWWYTRTSFIYSQLNHALRTLEGDIIIKMGFFIRDLHKQIEQLHQQQITHYNGQPFTVYRGQGLSIRDFKKLRKSNGGLISFNNFLSTSRDHNTSLAFAASSSTQESMIGILFEMSIDPVVKSTSYADVTEVSYYRTEEEILFSMHTVFRIREIKQIDINDRLYKVELQLTADDDEELRILTQHIAEASKGNNKWKRLGDLLLDIGQTEKAEELYNVLLNQTLDEGDQAHYYQQLGYVNVQRANYQKAAEYSDKALEIRQKTLPANHSDMATSYDNIGSVCQHTGEYATALSFYDKALEISQKTLPANHLVLATAYNNIGIVCQDMGEYAKALSFYDKALVIRQKTLPANHPDIAASYNNIGIVCQDMGEYAKALSFLEKAMKIHRETLPANHPDMATSYNNIGMVCRDMKEYSKALSFLEKGLEIRQKGLLVNHPYMATSYNNIGLVYKNMGEYAKALSFLEKAMKNYRETLPANHPDMAISYNNIGLVYKNMEEYAKALSFLEKAMKIHRETLPANHPDIATSYNNIGMVCRDMKEYSKALSFLEKGLEIRQKGLLVNHPDIAASYNNIGLVCHHMGEYAKALSYFEKALEILQKTLPTNSSLMATSYNNVGLVYQDMGEYPKALLFLEKGLEIRQRVLLANHPDIASSYNNIGFVYENMGEYAKALSYFESALNIKQRVLPPAHSSIQSVKQSIEIVKKTLDCI